MILVDSSVWIDYFNGTITPYTNKLDDLLGSKDVGVGDLILAEVLQGFESNYDFERASDFLTSFVIVNLGGKDIAIRAAQNFRTLRRRGVTIRSTIDAIIATRCIVDNYRLLHNDRDFDPFVKHLGLQSVI